MGFALQESEEFYRQNPSVLTDQLYLAAYAGISHKKLSDLDITCIINATLELPTMASQKHDAMQIAVEDRVASNLYVYFEMVADKIHSVHRSGGKVMVYCRAGMSRSASLCIAYFMRHKDMNLEDAFNYVKQCRPIIHPNVGFMRQLREYEAKVLARKSRQKLNLVANPSAAGIKRKHSIAMGRGGLVIGEPMPELVYSEEHICDEIDIPILGNIPPRPKPRIMKLKPWVSERLMESYELVTVQVLGSSTIDAIEEEPSSTVDKNAANLVQKTSKPRRRRHNSRQQNAVIAMNKENLLGVAQTRCDTPYIDICPAINNDGSHLNDQGRGYKGTQQPTAPPRRKPFTKISMEATKIPVSCMTVPLGICAEFKMGQKLADFFSRETAISLSSFMTGCKGEGVLIAATEHQELVLECCSDNMSSDISPQTVITSSNLDATPSFTTNNYSQIANASSRHDNKNKSKLSVYSSNNNSRHSNSQRHHPYSFNITSSKFTVNSPICGSDIPASTKLTVEKARIVFCQPQTGVASVCLPQTFECSGLYKKQNLPGSLTHITASVSHIKQSPALTSMPNVPSRFSSISSNQNSSSFSRATASRKSIKLSEGLKISPLPDKHNKRSEIILPKSNEYQVVAIAYQHPIILERADQLSKDSTSSLKTSKSLHLKAKIKLYAPSFGVAEVTGDIFTMGCVYESATVSTGKNFIVAHLLTIPRRTVILSSGYVVTSDIVTTEMSDTKREDTVHMTPTKEYPYYSPHHISYNSTSAANNMLQRATIEPSVESSWFFGLSSKSSLSSKRERESKKNGEKDSKPELQKPVEPKTSSFKPNRRLLKEPELRWAAERCEYQQDFISAKSLADLLPPCKATTNIVTKNTISSRGDDFEGEKKKCDLPLRFDAFCTLDYRESQPIALGELKASPKRPESYYAAYIMRMCAYPLYAIVTIAKPDFYENTNLFCEPTPFKDYAKIVTVGGAKTPTKGNSSLTPMSVAIGTKIDIMDNFEDIVDIPIDTMSVTEMKNFFQNRNINEVTMSIWLDVLKTSIMRARPIHPLVSVSELHGIAATCSETTLFFEDSTDFDKSQQTGFSLTNLSSKYSTLMIPSAIRARAMPLTVQRQPVRDTKDFQSLCYPVEIFECFCVDVFHETTAPIQTTKMVMRTEKCSESRSYIRDYIISYWSEPVEELTVTDIINSSTTTFASAKRSDAIDMNLVAALSTHDVVYDETQLYPLPVSCVGKGVTNAEATTSLTRPGIRHLLRQPFRIVSGIRPVAEKQFYEVLNSDQIVPSYPYNGDVVNYLKPSLHADTSCDYSHYSIIPPVDTFWYFKLDTPKTHKRDIPLEDDTVIVKRPTTPLPVLGEAKSFQLFLPDPDMIDRLANSFVTEEETKHLPPATEPDSSNSGMDEDVYYEAQTSIDDGTIEPTDLVLGSVKDRKTKGERRVVIADPPATVNLYSTESPTTMRKRLGSIGKLISYQRPRDESPQASKPSKGQLRPRSRSRSKNRKKAEQAKKEKETEEDRQAIYDLQNSVQNVSYLLDKRRAAGKSGYYGSGSSATYSVNEGDSLTSSSVIERQRGRNRERILTNESSALAYNKDDRQRLSTTSSISTTTSNSEDFQNNSSSLRGLLGVAQSWLFSNKSRHEASVDRSKSILRRSKL